LKASGPRKLVTDAGNGPPDSTAFAASGWLSTVVEHPQAHNASVIPVAISQLQSFLKLFSISSVDLFHATPFICSMVDFFRAERSFA
jgi:hypothetical protein